MLIFGRFCSFILIIMAAVTAPAHVFAASSGGVDTPLGVNMLKLAVEGNNFINMSDSPVFTTQFLSNVGIGNAQTPAGLDVVGPSIPITFEVSNAANELGILFLSNGVRQGEIGYAGTEAQIANESYPGDLVLKSDNGNILFAFTNNSETKMIMTADGKVGIGTISPQAVLEVNGSINVGIDNSNTSTQNTTYGAYLNFLGANENTDALWIARYNVASDYTELRVNIGDNPMQINGDKFVIGTTSSANSTWIPAMTVTSWGAVGIGTNPPAGTLDVENGTGTANLCMNGTCINRVVPSQGEAFVVNAAANLSNSWYDSESAYTTNTHDLCVLQATEASGLNANCIVGGSPGNKWSLMAQAGIAGSGTSAQANCQIQCYDWR
jgi:hypothetical protein